MPIFWDSAVRRPFVRPFYRKLIALRRAHVELQQGPVEWLDNADADRVLSFKRGQFEITINCGNRPTPTLPAWGARVTTNGETLLELP